MTENNIQFEKQWRAGYEQEDKKHGFGKKITDILINYSGGLINNEKQANLVLFGVAGLFLLIAAFIFYKSLTPPKRPPRGFEGNYFESYDLPESM